MKKSCEKAYWLSLVLVPVATTPINALQPIPPIQPIAPIAGPAPVPRANIAPITPILAAPLPTKPIVPLQNTPTPGIMQAQQPPGALPTNTITPLAGTRPTLPPTIPNPAPQPAMTVAAPLPNIAQPIAPQPVVMATPTPITPSAATPQQELDGIKKTIEEISSLKKILKFQLENLDIKLVQTQEQLAQIKKKGFEILSKENETEAAQALNEMRNALGQVQVLQKEIETSVNQDFNATVQRIKNLMNATLSQLQSLNSKTSTLPTTPIQPLGSTPAISPAQTQPLSQSNNQPQTEAAQIIQSNNKPHTVLSGLTNIVAGSLSMVISALTALKELLVPEKQSAQETMNQDSQDLAKKKMTPTPPATNTYPSANLSPMSPTTPQPAYQPTTPSATAPIAQQVKIETGGNSFTNDIKSSIGTIDQIIQNLDTQRLSIKQTMREVKEQSNDLRQRIEKHPRLNQDIAKKLVFEKEGGTEYFKKRAREWFDILLDGVDITTTTITRGISSTYKAIKQGVEKAWQESSSDKK